MGVTNYYTIDSQMIGYKDANGRKDFLTDNIGSVTAEIDQTGSNRTFDGRYRPYGNSLWSTGTRGAFGWVGTWGYRGTGLNASTHYVRARHYSPKNSIWTTGDPVWPSQKCYAYVSGNPVRFVDPLGLRISQGFPGQGLAGVLSCIGCAISVYSQQGGKQGFHGAGYPAFAHCFACCVVAAYSDADCALASQELQSVKQGGTEDRNSLRSIPCADGANYGSSLGNRYSSTEACARKCWHDWWWLKAIDMQDGRGVPWYPKPPYIPPPGPPPEPPGPYPTVPPPGCFTYPFESPGTFGGGFETFNRCTVDREIEQIMDEGQNPIGVYTWTNSY